RLEQYAEDLVDELRGHGTKGDPPPDVDVAGGVDPVREERHPQVAPEEEAVELLVVLVGVADDEGGHRQRPRADEERGDRPELLLAGQGDDELAAPGAGLVVDARLVHCLAEDVEDLLVRAHRATSTETGRCSATAPE